MWKIVHTWEQDLKIQTPGTDPGILLALTLLAERDAAYLPLVDTWGESIGDMVTRSWEKNESLWLDAIEPLALLKWIALHQRQETAVAEPIYNRSSSQMGWSQNRTIK